MAGANNGVPAMTRKKPTQYVHREDRPEFLALVAELANVQPEQFPAIARQCAAKYHDAVLAGHVDVLDQMEMAYAALVYKLNGDTLHGCKANGESAFYVLERALAAAPGQVPNWGQAGEFLLEVDGLRVRVVLTSSMLGNHRSCDLHVVDVDKPFISATGYRSAILTVTSSIGETVDQAARQMVRDMIQSEGKLKPVEADAWARLHPEYAPGWLVDALAGVRPNGQLAMFGDVPKDPEAKVPLTNAQRQKALRERRKAQQLKPVMLTETERQWLDRLRELSGGESVHGGNGDFSALEVTDAPLLSVWKSLPTDFSRAATALGLLRLRNAQHAELAHAVEILQARLRDAGLSDRVTTDKKEWYWNRSPLEDYRTTSAPEYMERLSATPTTADELRDAQRYLANAQADIERLHEEQRKSFANNRVLAARLKAAGLSTDYSKQPGE
jgi:hypothetical protein